MCSAVALVLPTAPQIYGHKLNQSAPPPLFTQLPLLSTTHFFLMVVKNSWIDPAV